MDDNADSTHGSRPRPWYRNRSEFCNLTRSVNDGS